MLNLSTSDLDLITNSLKMEFVSLQQTMNNLARRGLINGDLNVQVQNRMQEINELMNKIAKD